MAEQPMAPAGLAMLDIMISRAEASCDRGRAELVALRLRASFGRKCRQRTMEATLARLRAQRAAAGASG